MTEQPFFKNYIVFILSLTLIFYGCNNSVSLETPPSILKTDNPTVKKIKFSLSDTAKVIITLRNLESNNLLKLNELSVNKSYNVLLPCLKPDQTYSISIKHGKKNLAQIDSFKTDPLVDKVVRIYKRANVSNQLDGYLLTQRRLVNGSVYMIDNESEVVWYQKVQGQPKLSEWTSDGEILVLAGNAKHNNSAGDKIIKYTIDGKKTYQIDLNELGLIAHHEVREYEDDIFFLAYDTKPNIVNGIEEEAISSSIIRISKLGEIIWKWSTFDIKDPVGIPTSKMKNDWGHANAFDFDDDGNLLISYRDWNQIWKIDIKTGKLIWTFGENGDFKFEDNLFNGQHAIHKNKNGDYMLFDNGKKDRQSRIVSYKLKDDRALPVTSINLTEDLYADRMGNVQVLPNDNILLCSPRSRSLVILNPNGDIVFHVNTGIPDPYRASYVPSFYSE